MRPLFIFDLDGTLADITHRRHFVENRANRWQEFFAACVRDEPKHDVISVMHALYPQHDVWIFSGRSDQVRAETMSWLEQHTQIQWSERDVRMRKAGDYTADDVLKRRWYEQMLDVDKARLVAVFDDRDRIVKMWRELGVPCYQVAPGDF